ncbi:unnamed protein product [Anisakis simplex]|uniref:50S ribosomal protein L15 n=1 Tax=Anisakis simplex TaxID=6269 RepID=A0A0M3JLT5_ANISI|nr:unnamed protein product [Anisakis simplex]
MHLEIVQVRGCILTISNHTLRELRILLATPKRTTQRAKVSGTVQKTTRRHGSRKGHGSRIFANTTRSDIFINTLSGLIPQNAPSQMKVVSVFEFE